jgi:hypothetical protein
MKSEGYGIFQQLRLRQADLESREFHCEFCGVRCEISLESLEIALLQPFVLLPFVESVGLKGEQDAQYDYQKVQPQREPVLIPNSVGHPT